jgi:NAD(P)-dependent dehydrogenase (short-subunit alcohol dehydrogenase family)
MNYPPKNAIVIGGHKEGSIGHAIAVRLAGDDYAVCTPARGELDVTDIEALAKFMQQHYEASVLVLSHGVACVGAFENLTPLAVIKALDINVFGTVMAAQEFVKATSAMPYRKTIVMIGSLGGERVFTNSSVYCASKAAVAQLGRCMAWELTSKGFDVYVVEPGNVSGTGLAAQVQAGMADPERFAQHPTRDAITTPPEVAALVFRIIKHDLRWLTGEPIRMSGGARG